MSETATITPEPALHRLRMTHLTKRHSDSVPPAVDDLSLDIEAGEFLTLLGPSGSGKTTLLNMLAGFSTPTAGSIMLGDRDITQTPVYRRNFGMVFQNYALFPHMSAEQNTAFPLRRRGFGKRDARAEAQRALAAVGLEGFESRRPNQLSGGQQQRVAVARAIVYRPQVVLMDEPFGALDKKLRQDLQIEMLRLHRDLGLTFVFVTHDQEEALSMSDRIAVLDRGRVQQVGTPEELYDAPATEFVARFIGESNRFSGTLQGSTTTSTELGRFAHPARVGLNDGQDVVLIVRPESVTLRRSSDHDRPEAMNALSCTVIQSIFLGDARKVVVRFADGSTGMAMEVARSGREFRRGEQVDFMWNPEEGQPVLQGAGESAPSTVDV